MSDPTDDRSSTTRLASSHDERLGSSQLELSRCPLRNERWSIFRHRNKGFFNRVVRKQTGLVPQHCPRYSIYTRSADFEPTIRFVKNPFRDWSQNPVLSLRTIVTFSWQRPDRVFWKCFYVVLNRPLNKRVVRNSSGRCWASRLDHSPHERQIDPGNFRKRYRHHRNAMRKDQLHFLISNFCGESVVMALPPTA